MFTSTSRGAKAFTLVELLVVIGIIALLVSILLPTLNKARKGAYAIKCQSNIRQIVNGMILYANEYKGWYPSCAGTGSWVTATPTPTDAQAQSDWLWWHQKGNPNGSSPRDLNQSQIARYTNARGEKLKELLRCPMDVVDVRDPGAIITAGPYTFSYTLCDRIGRLTWDGLPGNSAAGRPIKSKVIRSPAEKIMIAEEHQPNDGRWNVQLVTKASGDLLAVRHVVGMRVPTFNAIPDQTTWGKVKGAHVGMCDGHVELMSTIDSCDPKHWDPTIK